MQNSSLYKSAPSACAHTAASPLQATREAFHSSTSRPHNGSEYINSPP